MLRLDITPGMTDLWQVLGRSDSSFDEMVTPDCMYATGSSLSWDIKLLLKTIPAVRDKRGAYRHSLRSANIHSLCCFSCSLLWTSRGLPRQSG